MDLNDSGELIMAGEYKVAQELFTQAIDVASENTGMCPETMVRALLSEALRQMMPNNNTQQIRDLLEYELEALNETEFIITRGC